MVILPLGPYRLRFTLRRLIPAWRYWLGVVLQEMAEDIGSERAAWCYPRGGLPVIRAGEKTRPWDLIERRHKS